MATKNAARSEYFLRSLPWREAADFCKLVSAVSRVQGKKWKNLVFGMLQLQQF